MLLICAMVQLFSFGFASLNRTFHLSPHENICTIALITIHYLYNIVFSCINFFFHLRYLNQSSLTNVHTATPQQTFTKCIFGLSWVFSQTYQDVGVNIAIYEKHIIN